MKRTFLLLMLLLPACSDAETAPPQGEAAENCGTAEGTCNITTCAPDPLEARHVDPCTDITWPTNPPTSGQHYGIWAAFKDYEEPVSRGFWLHSAEHSGVVLAYNCDHVTGDCQELIDGLQRFAADAPDDPLCDTSIGNRIIVVPDPLLDDAFAAVAWGHSLKGSCFDETLTQNFVDAHYGNNYENFCNDGIDPNDPDEGYEAGCGLP